MRMKIRDVNALDYSEFIRIFGNVVEHNPLCAAAIWGFKPFKDINSIHQAVVNFLDSLPLEGKKGILRLYPDLAGQHAKQGTLSADSVSEHEKAGLFSLTKDESQRMDTLNSTYKTKFEFPFVICARQNKKESILSGLEKRTQNSPDVETLTGIGEVAKICLLRLQDIVDSESNL